MVPRCKKPFSPGTPSPEGRTGCYSFRFLRGNGDSELKDEMASLRNLAQVGGKPQDIEVRAFAIIREAARRTVELFPYKEQLLAALLLSRNKIVQMDTGEGKTLVAPFHAVLQCLYGRQVVVVTANEYLAARDHEWMAPLYRFFGLRPSVVLDSYHDVAKMTAYSHDVVYVSNDQLVFDYLLDSLDFGRNVRVVLFLIVTMLHAHDLESLHHRFFFSMSLTVAIMSSKSAMSRLSYPMT